MIWLYIIIGFLLLLKVTNIISYNILKKRILERKKWDLNICCGKTDGGGVNVDIMRHASVPNFVLVDDIYRLPFRDKQFRNVLCSHTMEHVDDPRRLYAELKRISIAVTVVVPPLWDITAALNILEHRWIFLCLKKEYEELPPFVAFPFAQMLHKKAGQRIHA